MADCYFLSSEFSTNLLRVVLGVYYFAGLSNALCPNNTCPRPEQTLSDRPDILPSLVADCYDDGNKVVMSCNRGFRSVISNYTTICNGENGKFEADESCRIDLLLVFVASILGMFAIAVCAVLLCYIIRIFRRHRMKGHDVQNADRNEPVIRAVYRAYGFGEPEPVAELSFWQDNCNTAYQTEPVCLHPIYENMVVDEEARIYENLPAMKVNRVP